MKRVLLVLIRGYQLVVSPLLGPRCRFYPSCSRYGYQAIERHGCFRGSWLTIRRLLRCHPWNPGGIDEVPPPRGVDQGKGPRSRGGRLSGLHLVPSRESESSALARVQCHEGAAR